MTELSFAEVDAILISASSDITYFTGYSNFSPIEREAYLLLTPQQKYIFTDARYSEAVSNLENFELKEVSVKVGMSQHLKDLSKKHQIKVLGIQGDNLTVSELRRFEQVVPEIKETRIHHLRAVKSAEEISKIEAACQLGDKGFKVLLKKIKPGISEKELAHHLEMFVKKQGAELSFETIVAFGSNSSVPHHHTGNRVLAEDRRSKTEGYFIKLDFGTKVGNYCSDMTRTVFFGKASAKQKKIYQTVLKAQEKAAEFLDKQIKNSKKVTGQEVDKVARDYIISQGFSSIPHGLGHGIGIEVHESPRLSAKSEEELKAGMVFSIEPGIYIPGYGGVRIEDLFVIEKNGLRLLTQASKKLTELG